HSCERTCHSKAEAAQNIDDAEKAEFHDVNIAGAGQARNWKVMGFWEWPAWQWIKLENKRLQVYLPAAFITIIVSLLCLGLSPDVFAVVMKGKVYDMKSNKPMPNVNIVNTFTGLGMTTDSSGVFTVNVEKGHLVEFTRMGYKVARVRIDVASLPFYSIAMREGAIDIPEVEVRGNAFRTDSIENRETYKWAIEHYKLEGLDVIQHPFDALSKRNRQIWAFQKRYEYFEKEKFVDYVFNERLINKVAPIDSLEMEDFRRYYRPTYEQIKSWTEYEFLEYIKRSAAAYMRRRG
ncbi:MAG: carboxypeptidase-like regulatory domain-containing protein, partial [Sphingobacteriales bacterium]